MGEGHRAIQTGLGNGLAARRQRCSRLGNVPAAAIVEAHIENEARVFRRGGLCLRQAVAHFGRQARALTYETDTDTVLFELRHFAGQRHGQQLHETRDLIDRTIPVFRRKSKNGQHRHTPLHAGACAAAQRINPLFVARQARQKPARGPAAVAIHDDGDVVWHHQWYRHVKR